MSENGVDTADPRRLLDMYNSVAWRRVRLLVLARDEHLCQIRGRRCLVAANEADHIIRPAEGGSWFDPENLRAACKPCNSGRGGRLGAEITNQKRWAPSAAWRPSREW